MSTVSGVSKSYHSFHVEGSAVKSLTNSAITGFNPLKHNKSFHPVADNQSVGFTSTTSSKEVSPFKKKSKIGCSNLPLPFIIIHVIWKLNINLCFSKIPVHV